MVNNSPMAWEPELVEEPFPGIIREWFSNHKIVVYRPESMLATDVSNWADGVSQVLQAWPENMPYLALHDISAPRIGLAYVTIVKYDIFNIGITAAGWRQAQDILANRGHFKARIALLFGLSHSGHLSQTLTHHRKRERSDLDIEFETFFEREQALEWLTKYV